MEKLNITSIYSLTRSDGQKSFFYTVRRPSQLGFTEYNYYILSKDENHIPQIRKVHHAINLLQDYGRDFKLLDRQGEEYKDFISDLAQAIKPRFDTRSNLSNTEQKLKKYTPWSAKQFPKKK